MVLAARDFVSPLDLVATTTAFFGGEIDLDPASSTNANYVIQANRFFNWEQNGLHQSWKAKNVYLFPPRDLLLKHEQPKSPVLFQKKLFFKKSAQRVWLELCYHKWLRQEFEEAVVLITSSDVALIGTQKMGIDTPICILREHPKLMEDTPDLKPLKRTKVYGFVFYFPPTLNIERKVAEFSNQYSLLGRVYSQ